MILSLGINVIHGAFTSIERLVIDLQPSLACDVCILIISKLICAVCLFIARNIQLLIQHNFIYKRLNER